MKRFFALTALTAVLTLLVPVLFQPRGRADPAAQTDEPGTETVEPADDGSVRVFSHLTGKVDEMPLHDYIVGVVAAEMPAEYEPEALKAQAVAAIAYTEYTFAAGSDSISTDSGVHQGCRTEEEMRAAWGGSYEEFRAKVDAAVTEAERYTLRYDGEPVLAVYFAVSSGQTEDAREVWGKPYPYLVSVPSDGDVLAPEYESEKTLSVEELCAALKTVRPPEDTQEVVGESETTDAGTVREIKLCGTVYTGAEVRTALDLPSAAFTVTNEDGEYRFRCKGCGHNVGMSQYGADYMARQGASFKEILTHYFPGTELVERTQ